MTDGPLVYDLVNHIISTKDPSNNQGKYVLRHGVELKDILSMIPIPSWCENCEDAYYYISVIRRMIALGGEHDRDKRQKERLKIAHEIAISYEVKP